MKHTLIKKLIVASSACLPAVSLAQANMAITQSVPTMDEVGLAALVVAVSGLAGWMLKHRKK